MFAKILIILFITTSIVTAQITSGDLDLIFVDGGKVTYRFNEQEVLRALLILSIVVF